MLTALFANPAQASAVNNAEPNSVMMLVPFILIFGIFYFLVIRPQNKRIKLQQQEQAQMLAALKKGDQIMTAGGVFATVHKMVNDEQIEIEISQGVYVKILKTMISKSLSAAPAVEETSENPAPKAKTVRAVTKKDKGA